MHMNIERDLCRLILTSDLNSTDIGRLLNMSEKTVRRRRKRLAETKATWEQIQALDDQKLEALVRPKGGGVHKPFFEPDWDEMERELQRKGVTKALLFEEYCSTLPPPGTVLLSDRHFCRKFTAHRKRLGISMRQIHRAGEKMFVDFSGLRAKYFNAQGMPIYCEVFVAALGASAYSYAEAVHSQKLQDWIMVHVRAFQFFGGAPRILVPDCLRSAVKCWRQGQAEINDSYREMATHYGAVVQAARPRRPKDKGKVENAVRCVQMWILAAIRNRTFHSLTELNAEIRRLLVIYNARPFRKRKNASRRSLFEGIDQPHLQALPACEYEHGEWTHVTVPKDYIIVADGRGYSVPYSLIHKKVSIKLLDDCVKVYHLNREVATHPRNRNNFDDTIVDFHRAPNHRFATLSKADYALKWAEQIGGDVLAVMTTVNSQKASHLIREQNLDGIKKLAGQYGLERLRAACTRALLIDRVSFRSLRTMLSHNMESAPVLPPSGPKAANRAHRNVRGASYFGNAGGLQ